MSTPRYEREIDESASPRFARMLFVVFGTAALIGLVVGFVWVVAGLLHFHPLW
jgi:hypothetical protein